MRVNILYLGYRYHIHYRRIFWAQVYFTSLYLVFFGSFDRIEFTKRLFKLFKSANMWHNVDFASLIILIIHCQQVQ